MTTAQEQNIGALQGDFMKDAVYDEFIDRLRSECDIVSILSDYVPLKKKGKNYWGCCPFHHEKTPSFSVTPDKGFFYCFGCHTGGNVFNFLMKMENIAFFDAVKLLAQKMNIPLPQQEKTPQEQARDRKRARLYRSNELAREFFHVCLTKSAYGKPAGQYLQTRGITDAVCETFQLGFAPPAWDKLVKALSGRGIEAESLLESGLASQKQGQQSLYDRFRNRIMFPICDPRGRVVGFGGRVMDDSQPKYLNSPETVIFNKRHLLFALHMAQAAIRDTGQAIVVEGYMDAITAHAAGITNVVASLGTAFTVEQAKLLQKIRQDVEVLFAYDSDAAGQNASLRALNIVHNLGLKVRVVAIPDGKDPDDFIRKHGAEAFRALLPDALHLLEYQVQQALDTTDYSGLEGKVAVVSRLVPVLAETANAVEANAQIARIAQTLAIDESAVRSEISKFLLQAKKDKNVKPGKHIAKTLISHKPSMANEQAERYLIRLMNDDPALIPTIRAALSGEEIRSQVRQEILQLLFRTWEEHPSLDSAWTLALSEAATTELSQIMVMDIHSEHVTKTVEDCIKSLRLLYLNTLYEQHRLRADELERMGDSRFLQELAESQRIKNEINKLHCL